MLPFVCAACLNASSPPQVALAPTTTDTLGSSSGGDDPGVFSSTAVNSSSSGETTGDESTSSSGGGSSSTSTGEGSTSELSTSTGEVLPECRNGDPDAVCRVFVSSAVAPANLLAGGFDTLCTDLACNASAPCAEYRALVRVDGDFWGPLAGFAGRFVLTSGATVAQGVNGLEASLPIILDETGAEVSSKEAVWTGYSGAFMTCLAGMTPWGSTAANTYGDVGFAGGEGESKWSAQQVTCDTMARVYCVEVPAE